MNFEKLAESLAALFAQTTSQPRWIVAAIRPAGAVAIIDHRPDATRLVVDAIADQHGDTLASIASDDTPQGDPIIVTLIRPTDPDIDRAADMIRTAYFLASEPDNDDEGGPF